MHRLGLWASRRLRLRCLWTVVPHAASLRQAWRKPCRRQWHMAMLQGGNLPRIPISGIKWKLSQQYDNDKVTAVR